jgi:hypothetical protein
MKRMTKVKLILLSVVLFSVSACNVENILTGGYIERERELFPGCDVDGDGECDE